LDRVNYALVGKGDPVKRTLRVKAESTLSAQENRARSEQSDSPTLRVYRTARGGEGRADLGWVELVGRVGQNRVGRRGFGRVGEGRIRYGTFD